jgi:hypothetical protein
LSRYRVIFREGNHGLKAAGGRMCDAIPQITGPQG